MRTVVAVQHTHLHGLVDLAESSVQAGLHRCLGIVTRLGGIGVASGEATLHQGAQRRLVSPVVEAIALCDLNALLRRLVIGH